jgi:hypothetical protein
MPVHLNAVNVNEMKLNKSPGLDGLSVEFYRTFWDKLKYFLIKTYNKGYNENMLTYSQPQIDLSFSVNVFSSLFSKIYFCNICLFGLLEEYNFS